MWTCKVQTRVVQESTVPYKPSYGILVHVCVCVCMYICIHMYMCVCVYIYIYTHTYIHAQICKVENDKHQKVSNIYLWKRSSPILLFILVF